MELKTAIENVVRAHKAKLTKSDASDAQKALVKQVESHFSPVVWDLVTAQSATFSSMLPTFLFLSSCMVQQIRLALRSPKHYRSTVVYLIKVADI